MITYELTVSDYVASQRLHALRLLRWAAAAASLCWVAVIVLAVWDKHFTAYTIPAAIGSLTVVFILLLQRYCLIYIHARREFKQRKALQRRYTINLTDAAFVCESETGVTRWPWTDFLKWKMNDRVVLLYMSSRTFFMIPRRALGAEGSLESLVSHLQARPHK